jgi:hypothetical protein
MIRALGRTDAFTTNKRSQVMAVLADHFHHNNEFPVISQANGELRIPYQNYAEYI